MINENTIYDGVKIIDSHLGDNIIIGKDSFITGCTLSDYVQLNRRNFIEDTKIGMCTYTGINTIVKHADIGRYCSISWNVSIAADKHNYKFLSPHPLTNFKSFGLVMLNKPLDFDKITIGNDVWIGMNSCILPGVKIGNGAIIGAGSVVTRNVPDYAIVAGNPAKIIKFRFSDNIIKILKQCEWWNWKHSIIKAHMELFRSELDSKKVKTIVEISRKFSGINCDFYHES